MNVAPLSLSCCSFLLLENILGFVFSKKKNNDIRFVSQAFIFQDKIYLDKKSACEFTKMCSIHNPYPSGGTHDHMFSEGTDAKASTGLLKPCGGFYIVVPYIDHTTRKTEIKSLEPETSSSPELAHIFM